MRSGRPAARILTPPSGNATAAALPSDARRSRRDVQVAASTVLLPAGSRDAALAVGTGAVPGEPEIAAAWLLGRVPAGALPWPLLRPGRAGRGPGPDIREAAARLPSGVPAVGDVEVHRLASDFARHGHAEDQRYARVLLHLVWRDDRPSGERGGPVRLAGGRLAPTVALEEVFRHPAALTAAVAQGPVGAGEPCATAAREAGPGVVRQALRREGHRRIAERTWRAQRLAEEVGWEAAWRTLLDRSLTASAGRRPEGAATRVALADRITAEVAREHGGDPVRAIAERVRTARGVPARLIAPARAAGLGPGRALEAGWNAFLPLAAALAAAYGDRAVAEAVNAAVEAWPAPAPYGRTRALTAQVGVTPADALTAQGLLRMQDLWCTRGGCGLCPLSAGLAG